MLVYHLEGVAMTGDGNGVEWNGNGLEMSLMELEWKCNGIQRVFWHLLYRTVWVSPSLLYTTLHM